MSLKVQRLSLKTVRLVIATRAPWLRKEYDIVQTVINIEVSVKKADYYSPCTRTCIDCKQNDTERGPRCLKCHRLWTKNAMARLRYRKRKEELRTEQTKLRSLGWQRCSKCYRKKLLSEFSTTLPNRKGILRKICDTCLTRININKSQLLGGGFSPTYWRQRAYSCNSCARNRLKRETLTTHNIVELSWECKPQDLVDIYNKQAGKCGYCNVDITRENMNIDHSDPMSRFADAHRKDNIIICCEDCNQLKAARTKTEFIAFAKSYAERLLTRMTELQNKESVG